MCPTRYRTWHFFNNSNTNEDTATKFEQGYVRCVRNEEECACSEPNCCDTVISGKIIKEMLGSGASGTHCTMHAFLLCKPIKQHSAGSVNHKMSLWTSQPYSEVHKSAISDHLVKTHHQLGK
jgi:hypothetical protein